MKVYYHIEGKDYFTDSELGNKMNDLLDRFHALTAQKLKYQIMWSLRSLEKELEESGGAIIIDWDDYTKSPRVYAKDIDDELGQKINEIAWKTKF